MLTRLTTAVAASALLLGGCAASGAGSQLGATAPVTLRFANGNTGLAGVPAIARFIDRVKERTGGHVVVAPDYFETDDPARSTEAQLVKAVADRTFDLGWVGVRALPSVGVPQFAALEAPGLIDDYAVQTAVLTSDIPTSLLRAVPVTGVEGLAILGDHLRMPFASAHPLREPADFAGRSIWVNRISDVERATVTTLGATVADQPSSALSSLLSAHSADVVFDSNTMIDNGLVAPYVTTNLVFWPRDVVLIANPDSLAALSDGDAAAVRAAAADAANFSLTMGPSTDTDQLTKLCGLTTRAELASVSQLAAMRTVFRKVADGLRKDAATSAILDRISEIKSTTVPQPVAVPAECTGPPLPSSAPSAVPPRPPAVRTPLDGTYRQVTTEADLRAVGFTESSQPDGRPCMSDSGPVNCLVEDAGTFTYVLDKGRYSWSQRQVGAKVTVSGTGYYVVSGDILFIIDDEPLPSGDKFMQQFTWKTDDKSSITVVAQDRWNVSRAMAATQWIRVSS